MVNARVSGRERKVAVKWEGAEKPIVKVKKPSKKTYKANEGSLTYTSLKQYERAEALRLESEDKQRKRGKNKEKKLERELKEKKREGCS